MFADLFRYFFSICIFFFFFFQAEDGIRDGRVTGVQTCALPISLVQMVHEESIKVTVGLHVGEPEHVLACRRHERSTAPVAERGSPAVGSARGRSEERRVGKECRARGWPYQ